MSGAAKTLPKNETLDEADAFQRASLYHTELSEIYKYFMPYRQSTVERSTEASGPSEGQSRTDHLFDGTGLSAAFNFAGLMSADWMPPFQNFFKIEAGPLVPRDARDELNRQLESVTDMAHGVLPRVRLAAHEMFGDLFAGTGALLLRKGDDKRPVRGMAVPIQEIALEDNDDSETVGVWWRRNYKYRKLEETWPDGKWSDEVAKHIKDDRTGQVRITQSTRWDAGAQRWMLRVYAQNDKEHLIWEEDYRTNPWQIVRHFKVPGEAHGRGLAHLALPFQKSANKIRELEIRAAVFALVGIWMRRNDGVFNPATADFAPLNFWTVATTGGPLGPSIQRLPVPQDFDVSNVVMKDERDQINKVLLNDELPELQDSVRSPTEIAARLRRAAKSKGGVGARIAIELIGGIAQRTVEILEVLGKLDTNLTIDQLLTQTTVTAPAAAAQRADKVQWAVDWMQMMLGLMGPQAVLVAAKVEDLMPEIGRWMGVDETFIRSANERKEFQKLIADIVAQQQQAAAKGAERPPAPGAQFMNGAH